MKKYYINEDIIKKILEDNEQEKTIASNSKYINWLEKFTERYPRFTDDEFLDKKKTKYTEDVDGINKLNIFYKVIEQYAEKNYIYLTEISDYSGYYGIKYNNVGYKIGYMIGQGTLFFCERIDNPEDNFIDFNDILLNKKQPNTDKINKLLEELVTIIAYFHEQGVPLPAIKRSVNEILKSLNNEFQRKEKPKIKTYE